MAPPTVLPLAFLRLLLTKTSTTLTFYKSGTFRYEDVLLEPRPAD